MIYPLKDGSGFVISSQGTWLPGIYDSEKTARYAFKLKNHEMDLLSKEYVIITKVIVSQTIKSRHQSPD